jgi:hypothetical protein
MFCGAASWSSSCIAKGSLFLCLLQLYAAVFDRHKDAIFARRMIKDCRGLSNAVLARNNGRVAATSVSINQAKQSSDMYTFAH